MRVIHSKNKQAIPVDGSFESLFLNISARPEPPADITQSVYTHVLADWKKLRVGKKWKKRITYWSVAASVVLAILVSPVMFQSHEATVGAQAVGLVENYEGTVSVFQKSQRIQLRSGDEVFPLFSGQTLSTAANSGVSINWGSGNWGTGSTIRIDQNTELKLRSPTEIELVTGQIYVDIPNFPDHTQANAELQIETRFGLISHTGTQFMVSSDAATVQVKVREGSVSVDNNKQVFVTTAGQQATLDGSDQISHKAVITYGPGWQWAENLAPAFLLEGHSLMDFLTWIHKETGKDILFKTAAARSIAINTIMHGSVDDDPLKALGLVLQTNELSWYEQDGKIYLLVSR